MAETTKMKVFTYDNLVLYDELLKNHISQEDAKSLKTVAMVEGTDKYTIKFYKVIEPVGETEPAYQVEIPKTDVSGFISKITGAVAGDVVTVNADGTVADSGVKLADLAAKTEVTDLANGAVKTNTDDIAVLKGDATKEGSVAKAVKDSADAINATISGMYTNDQIDEAIRTSVANADHLKREIVNELPPVASADANTIYMVSITDGSGNQKYEEFMLINDAFEKIGDSAVDLTDYATKTYADNAAKAVLGTDADTKEINTVYGVKAYANDLNTAMDTRVDALEGKVGDGFEAITAEEINALFTA